MNEFGNISRGSVLPNRNRAESLSHSTDLEGDRSQFLTVLGTTLRIASWNEFGIVIAFAEPFLTSLGVRLQKCSGLPIERKVRVNHAVPIEKS